MAKSKSLNPEQQAAIEIVKQDIKNRIAKESISLNQAIQIFKDCLDNAIIIAGEKGKESLIRSQEPIKIFHEVIKQELINNGVNPNLIHPALNKTKGEIRLYGFFKDKDQDICIFPNEATFCAEILTSGLLHGQSDPLGYSLTQEVLSINVRSQMSSIANNIDTMFERIFAEPLNLHMRCPRLVLGEFYIIPTTGYDLDKVKLNNPTFLSKKTTKRGAKSKTTAEVIEEYILAFQSVNDRNLTNNEDYKYEKVCLLVVDFTTNPYRIYQDSQQLKNDNLLPPHSHADLSRLSFNNFIPDLLQIYSNRFGTGKFN